MFNIESTPKTFFSHKITKTRKFTKYYYIDNQFFVGFCVLVL